MINLTREQRLVTNRILKRLGRDQVVSLGGYAGTGKTTVVCYLKEQLPGFAVCAYTGKAAHGLRLKGVDAGTIHGRIYNPSPQPGGGVMFVRKQPFEVGCEGFLVDEASMVSKVAYEDLLRFNMPIIAVGDHGQLEAIGDDANLMAEPMYRLETIHRNAGVIACFAEHLRKGKPPRSFQGDGKVRLVDANCVTDRMLLRADQIICAFNRTRCAANQHIRRLLGHKGLVEKGDRIVCLRNNRNAGLFNGQQGTVTKVHKGRVPRLDFVADGGALYDGVPYDPRCFGREKPDFDYNPDAPHPFDYAYAVTAHKAQGSEWDRVLVMEPPACGWWDHKRWAYTAASRAKRRLTWVLAP
jgi:exodeoxyribonuclease-5